MPDCALSVKQDMGGRYMRAVLATVLKYETASTWDCFRGIARRHIAAQISPIDLSEHLQGVEDQIKGLGRYLD